MCCRLDSRATTLDSLNEGSRMFRKFTILLFLIAMASGCGTENSSPVSMVSAGKNLPVLSLIGSLGGLLDEVREIRQSAQNLPDDVSRTADNLEGNLQRLIDKLSDEYKSNVSLTFDNLNETEKRFFEDSENTVAQLQRLIDSANGNASETCLKALGDADILLYNTSERFLFRNAKPRIVYSWPEELVRGKDVPEVTVHGNFLNDGLVSVIVDGSRVVPIASRGNQIKIPLPDKSLASLAEARSLPIKMNYKYKGESFSTSASCLVKPKVTRRIVATIRPTAQIPEYKNFPFPHDHGRVDHEADVRRSKIHTLPAGYEVESWKHRIISHNGRGGGVTSISKSGKSGVKVNAHIKGNGVVKVLGAIVDHKGRGWLHYHVDVKGKKLVRKPLTVATHEKRLAQDQFEFTFPYEKALPESASGVQWNYDIQIESVSASGEKEIVQLSNANPNSERGYASRIENGKLALSVVEM